MRWTAGWLLIVVLTVPACGDRTEATGPGWVAADLLDMPVELPRRIDVTGDEGSASDDDPWLSVALLADGTVLGPPSGDGTRQSGALGAEDPGEQDDAIQALTGSLEEATSKPEWRDEDGSSRARVLVYADWRTKWKHVQWTMQACADPRVKVHRLAFALRDDGKLRDDGRPGTLARYDVELPKDRGLAAPPFPSIQLPKVKIKLFRRNVTDKAQAYTLVKVDNDKRVYHLPKDWRGWVEESQERKQHYDRNLKAIQETVKAKVLAYDGGAGDVRGEIVAPPPSGGAVPHGDVVALLGVLRGVGITDIVYEGAATPLTSRERAARRATGR
jgi:hypothetical protein